MKLAFWKKEEEKTPQPTDNMFRAVVRGELEREFREPHPQDIFNPGRKPKTDVRQKIKRMVQEEATRIAAKALDDALGASWTCLECGKKKYFSVEEPAKEKLVQYERVVYHHARIFDPLPNIPIFSSVYLCADCDERQEKENECWKAYPAVLEACEEPKKEKASK